MFDIDKPVTWIEVAAVADTMDAANKRGEQAVNGTDTNAKEKKNVNENKNNVGGDNSNNINNNNYRTKRVKHFD